MEIKAFLSELELHFPMSVKTKDKMALMKSYHDNLTDYLKGKENKYDLQKVLTHLLQNYKYAKLPSLAEIIESLPHGYIEAIQECIDAGKVLVVTLPTGRRMDFVITTFGQSKDEVLAKLYKRYGQCKVDIYPEGTCLIGNQIVTP